MIKTFERLTNVDEVKLIEVIEVKSIVGAGDGVGLPIRQIREYFSKEGELLARRDHVIDPKLQKGLWHKDLAALAERVRKPTGAPDEPQTKAGASTTEVES